MLDLYKSKNTSSNIVKTTSGHSVRYMTQCQIVPSRRDRSGSSTLAEEMQTLVTRREGGTDWVSKKILLRKVHRYPAACLHTFVSNNFLSGDSQIITIFISGIFFQVLSIRVYLSNKLALKLSLDTFSAIYSLFQILQKQKTFSNKFQIRFYSSQISKSVTTWLSF